MVGGGGVQFVSMSRNIDDMVTKMTKMTNGSDAVTDLLKKFPENQMELTVRQAFSTLANLERISARMQFLLERTEPKQVEDFIKGVTDKLAAINGVDLQHASGQILGLVEHANRIMAGVQTDHVTGIFSMLSQLDATKFNALVENTKAIEERLRSLHEIKISI